MSESEFMFIGVKPCMGEDISQTVALTEIAYQLKRIADKLEGF